MCVPFMIRDIDNYPLLDAERQAPLGEYKPERDLNQIYI